MTTEAELDRQRRLMAGLLADRADPGSLPTREAGARALRGLQAYRANADASADRALAGTFPTVRQLVGEHDFALLARAFWRDHPPGRGDLGEWGADFASWLSSRDALADWPYVPDCARLDWALHCCERAPDAALDAASIEHLGDTDPDRLAIDFMPGLALVDSPWPIARIHAAHHRSDPRAFDAAREAIHNRQAEAVVAARQGWKAVPTVVDAATMRWMQSLQGGARLGDALMAAASSGFDFGAWLALALQSAWVKGIHVHAD